MTLRFGTDGVRGVANRQLTPEFVVALGRAAARSLDARVCAIGRDTRRSGPMLSAALATGLASEGVDVVDLGVVPTPAVAHWSALHGHPGAVISASHNPFGDNGVKFFAAGGRKLSDASQEAIEGSLEHLLAHRDDGDADDVRVNESVGTIGLDETFGDVYVAYLVNEVSGGRQLGGMKVMVDAANGAASALVADVFTRLGATVTVIHAEPDGTNINAACGSTFPADLQRGVVAKGAHLGLALDGDADRLVAVDETGGLVDGDALMAMFALDLAEAGQLRNRAIVATVMSNLGLRRTLEPAGIDVIECGVGDRNVLMSLDEHDLVLGGEQSGHLIFTEHSTTGDGLLAGVLLADLAKRAAQPLSALASVIKPLPQVLRNVRLEQAPVDLLERIAPAIHAAETRLGDAGRVLVRLSGTEPLARVMVEAIEIEEAETVVAELVLAVEQAASRTP